jgi:GrpB-like predicted nucleotidyltransferase (UPF0157 family)
LRVFRFDPEVSIPIDHFGSQFRIGPLTGPDARVRAQVMWLAPGDSIGRHPTGVRQLFAVVAGSAVVSGADGVPRTLTVGQAAAWDVGEDHDARSDEGCTALCLEGRFEMWATEQTKEIVVEDWSPEWATWFEQLQDLIWPAVSSCALRIDHVGSTSVEGLAAKPVIDMDVVCATDGDVRRVIAALREIGYLWRGDLGIEGRQAFRHLGEDDHPPHHLYAVVEGNEAHRDHVDLRDLLRTDADAGRRYGDLKRTNVVAAAGDVDRYVELKRDLVTELLARARHAAEEPPGL